MIIRRAGRSPVLKTKNDYHLFCSTLVVSVSSVFSLFSLGELNTFISSFKLMTQKTRSLFSSRHHERQRAEAVCARGAQNIFYVRRDRYILL